MFHEHKSALTLLRQLTAPMRHVHRREKEQCRRKGQFCLTVQSVVAWSELLTSSEKARPEEHASCCDPDKGETARQGSVWRAFGAKKPTPPATPFSRHSTVRREGYAARSPSYSRSGNSVFKRGPECITGECELMGDNVGGIAVHSGARIMAKAKPGAMLVS